VVPPRAKSGSMKNKKCKQRFQMQPMKRESHCSSQTLSERSSAMSDENQDAMPMFPAMVNAGLRREVMLVQPSPSVITSPDPLGPSLFCSEDFDKTDNFEDDEELLEVNEMEIPALKSVPPPIPPLQSDIVRIEGYHSPPHIYWGYPASPGYGNSLPPCPIHHRYSHLPYQHHEPPIFLHPNSAWLGSPQRCENSAFLSPQFHHHPSTSMPYPSCSPGRNPLTESPRLFPLSPLTGLGETSDGDRPIDHYL